MADIDGQVAEGQSGRERRERAMAEAALTLAEIGERARKGSRRGCRADSYRFAESLLTASDGVELADDDPEALLPIRSITAVEANVPAVELSRQRVVEEMEATVQRGLTDLVSAVCLCHFLPLCSHLAFSRTTLSSRHLFKPPTTFLSCLLWWRLSPAL